MRVTKSCVVQEKTRAVDKEGTMIDTRQKTT